MWNNSNNRNHSHNSKEDESILDFSFVFCVIINLQLINLFAFSFVFCVPFLPFFSSSSGTRRRRRQAVFFFFPFHIIYVYIYKSHYWSWDNRFWNTRGDRSWHRYWRRHVATTVVAGTTPRNCISYETHANRKVNESESHTKPHNPSREAQKSVWQMEHGEKERQQQQPHTKKRNTNWCNT